MWWLDPGKELLQAIFNRVMAPYLENLDMNQVNYGISSGSLTLRNLRLKREALDKFRLPVDVVEGNLGRLQLTIPWRNFNTPLTAEIDDLFLLVNPAVSSKYDPDDDERRAQAVKQERLRAAETLQMQGQTEVTEDSLKNQGFIDSIIAKIINNFQVTVKNIHIRYEDNVSVPGHPFSAGITLSGFTVISVDGNWQKAFVPSTAGAIHKLAELHSFAIYFNTDSESIAKLPAKESADKFRSLIATGEAPVADHQFVLKPVSGQGKITMNHSLDANTPKFDVEVDFEEIGFVLDNHQYRDVISMVDMYHFFLRNQQYRKIRPSDDEIAKGKAKAMWKFAKEAVLGQVHEKHRQWSWAHFAERRDDRRRYVTLYKQRLAGLLKGPEAKELDDLDAKLSYEDLRFYRSISRAELRKDLQARRKMEEEKKKEQQARGGGWLNWAWGSSSTHDKEEILGVQMNDQRKKELFDALDYDEKASTAVAFEPPKDSLKARIKAKLQKGSLSLRSGPVASATDVTSIVFEDLCLKAVQRPTNFDAIVSLGDLHVYDGTTPHSQYPEIVRIKREGNLDTSAAALTRIGTDVEDENALLMVKFEQAPLDERADNGLTVKLKSMEVVYHKGYVEAIYNFFKPPETQMESVAALLDVASETLEGFRNATRAGLEHALQAHKTIDVKMDLQAPIIIVPEDVKSKSSVHLIVDAGHLAIGSDLVPKKEVQEIYSKRNQQYTEQDYLKLEALMYDRFSVKLTAAQFILGNDFDSCIAALKAENEHGLHLLEKTNMEFSLHNSIVPTAVQLSKIKVSGKLPELALNFSNIKYKSLMKIIDAAIPKLGDPPAPSPSRPAALTTESKSQLPLSSNVFTGVKKQEYVVDEGQDDKSIATKDYFDAEDDPSRLDLHQKQFEFHFTVGKLQALLSKGNAAGVESPLAEVVLEKFGLDFGLAKFDMQIGVSLGSLSMNYLEGGHEPTAFISSEGSANQDLVKVKYTRVQPESPEFATVYESINQSVDVEFSTIVLRAQPEPVVALNDFIMSTFVPEKPTPVSSTAENQELIVLPTQPQPVAQSSTEQIRVNINLQGVEVVLMNLGSNIATLDLSKAAVSLLIRGDTLRVAGRLEDISIIDEVSSVPQDSQFKYILQREGDHFADFSYETFDPADTETFEGVNSVVTLRTSALKFNFLEQPLHEVYEFVLKLARLKGLYDAATQAAAQSVSEITRMRFDVLIKSPIIVFPKNPVTSSDALVLKLGEITARNRYEGPLATTEASLQGIGLTSQTYSQEKISTLKMIDDVLITATVLQTEGVDHISKPDVPDTKVLINVSDIKLGLTQRQYCDLIALTRAFSRVVESPSEATPPPPKGGDEYSAISSKKGALNTPAAEPTSEPVNLEPEIALSPRQSIYPTLDLELKIMTIKLQLFDDKAISEENLRSCGIARFALHDNSVRFKMFSNGGGEAEVILKSFTVSNTMPGPSKFREIIPAAKHDRNQFMVLFTMTGGKDSTSLAIVTVESPKFLFTLEPLFALGNFFASAFVTPPQTEEPTEVSKTQTSVKTKSQNEQPSQQENSLAFRVDLNDVSVTLLESDTDLNSQAVQLSIRQVMMSQQGVLALTVSQLGMSLTRMGQPDESVRFMDEIDVTLSLESKRAASLQRTNIEITAKPIVFRASQSDINLILAIVTRATQLAAQPTASDTSKPAATTQAKVTATQTRTPTISTEKPQLIMSTEKLKGSFDGFRLVLIGEGHEQPMIHLKTKPFVVNVQDWTGPLHASGSLSFDINYWNLTNSHWEPLLEPWTLSVEASRDTASQGLRVQITSPYLLYLNITTTFVELAIAATSGWAPDASRSLVRARGGTPPYRISNQTGSSLQVWSNTETGQGTPTVLQHGQTIDWRFDDWRSLREHLSTSGHNSIGLRFDGKEWDPIPSVTVDKEGQFPVLLRPKVDGILHRLLCDVTVIDNVKVVTLRSTYKIDNECMYPLEVILVDEHNKPTYALQKIEAKKSYSLPIEAVMINRIKIRPDAGFGFGWSTESYKWEDFSRRSSHTITCRSQDTGNAPFRLSLWAEKDNESSKHYPKLTLKLYPPIELENLLPYDIKYRVHDKATNTSSSEFLRQGGIFPIHTVTLDHLVLLNIAVQDSGVWKPSNFMIINTDSPSEFPKDKRLVLPDIKDRQLELRLNYIPHGKGNSFKLQIYSPYIVINKTGLPFEIRSVAKMSMTAKDIAGETRQEELAKPTPFMLSNTGGHEFVLKIGNSDWSETLDVEAPSAETDLVLPARGLEGHLGVSWTPGSGKYSLSKVITLSPRFIVKNGTSAIIRFREYGSKDQVDLQPNATSPILWTRREPDKLLLIAYPGLDTVWSEPINMENIGSVHIRLRSNDRRSPPQLIKADVEISGATIFVTLLRETKWPFRIENLSDQSFQLAQSNEAGVVKDKAPTYELAPKSALDYAWDFPADPNKFIRLTANGFSRTVQITEIGSLVPFKFILPNRSSCTVALDIRAEGTTQILSITAYNEARSVYKRARAPTGRQETLMSQEAFEAVNQESPPSFTLFLILEGFGLSLMNRSAVEVVYFSTKMLKLEYIMSDLSQTINLSIGHIQLDNQLPEATFQVVLQPSPLPSRRTGPPLPVVQSSVILLNDRSHGVTFVKYASILLQSLTIMVDEDFLMEIIDMTKIKGAWGSLEEDILIKDATTIPEPTSSASSGQEVYFEGLLLQPLRFIVSFVRAERTTQSTSTSRNPLATVLHALTMTLGNINGAPLEFSALILSDVRMSQSMLIDRIFRHYRQGVIQQLYKILGSIDFIGNPVGLFSNVSSGVMDIFYEPYEGVIMHGGSELGTGIAKGAASFLKKTTFGLADTVTRVTSSVGKGLSSATFDSEYQSRRRLAQRRNNPRHVFAGVAAGGSAMMDSLTSAVQGVIVQPVEGFDKEGGVGFAKGMAKGVAGLFVKPVVGVTDLFSITATGVRNTATMFDPPDRGRSRIPRHIPFDGVLKAYSSREAIGQQWLREVDEGNFKHQLYVAHIESEPNRQVCILTSTSIICAWTHKLRLCWDSPFSEIGTVSLDENGIRVLDRRKKEIGFIIITEQNDREWFYGQISKVIAAHNAMKRLESS
ncbi:hypothetical protein M408DRAFT_326439 [Serendipita vermifera MAFF 305830]|uniref:Vacuolar protein sorting-associated protein n=1 Tax=Serendipita vermifera MAFF 305830 TaxID=933852 RepID=A0A0C2X385_SERVB|nr:hypothetical protein M408DRAFT_326439 [Serendipita vermifera MAFF 305830]